MANAGQHTIKYKREGDYNHAIPRVCPVEYQAGISLFPGTCEKCIYGRGEHSYSSACSANENRRIELLTKDL